MINLAAATKIAGVKLNFEALLPTKFDARRHVRRAGCVSSSLGCNYFRPGCWCVEGSVTGDTSINQTNCNGVELSHGYGNADPTPSFENQVQPS